MRGRKPKPTRLKLIQGNPGKRPLNPHEPKSEIAIPTCPAHLNASAKAEWKRLAREMADMGVITTFDRAALAAYCQAYGRWVEAERKLSETPLLIKLPSGYIQQSPWLAIANKQLELLHKLWPSLGSRRSPAAGSKSGCRRGRASSTGCSEECRRRRIISGLAGRGELVWA